eukprot:COSAG06_NODE_3585_length_5149_cov_2.336436_9_plen_99_part_00
MGNSCWYARSESMHDLALASSSCMRRSRRGSGYEICRSESCPCCCCWWKRLSLRDGPTSQMRPVSLGWLMMSTAVRSVAWLVMAAAAQTRWVEVDPSV